MRILITGCFDILHPGHLFLMHEAANMGDLYVIIARDSTIAKYKHQFVNISALMLDAGPANYDRHETPAAAFYFAY